MRLDIVQHGALVTQSVLAIPSHDTYAAGGWIWAAKFWPPVIADGRIVRFESADKLDFLIPNLRIRGRFGLPKNLPPDGEIAALFGCEVGFNDRAVRRSEVSET